MRCERRRPSNWTAVASGDLPSGPLARDSFSRQRKGHLQRVVNNGSLSDFLWCGRPDRRLDFIPGESVGDPRARRINRYLTARSTARDSPIQIRSHWPQGTRNGAMPGIPPTCNAKASLCMRPCAARSSHLDRTKFIPQLFVNARSITSQSPAMMPGLCQMGRKVT